MPAGVELLVRRGRTLRQAAQTRGDRVFSSADRSFWCRLLVSGTQGVLQLGGPAYWPLRWRLLFRLLRAGRLSRSACDGGVAMAGNHDGADLGQGIPSRHIAPARLFQPVLACPGYRLGRDFFVRLPDEVRAMNDRREQQ